MKDIGSFFSVNRLLLCLKRDMKPNSRSLFIILGAAVGFLLIISAFDAALGDNDPEFHEGLFYPILMIGGFIFVSGIFKEVHRKETNQTYLMLPASSLEKVLSRLLLATVGWAFFSVLWFTAYSAVSEGVNSLFFGRTHPLFNPFAPQLWETVAHYSVLQSIFLVGAIFFRKLHFFKTVLSLAVLTIGLSLFGALLVRIIFADYFTGTLLLGDGGEGLSFVFEQASYHLTSLGRRLTPVKAVVYWVLFPLFCWTLVYIRFREVQIKDGV